MAITDDQMARINFLARKSKAEGLTDAEKVEQHELRMAYVAAVKASLTPLLESITVVAIDEATGEQRIVQRAANATQGLQACEQTVIVEETIVETTIEVTSETGTD